MQGWVGKLARAADRACLDADVRSGADGACVAGLALSLAMALGAGCEGGDRGRPGSLAPPGSGPVQGAMQSGAGTTASNAGAGRVAPAGAQGGMPATVPGAGALPGTMAMPPIAGATEGSEGMPVAGATPGDWTSFGYDSANTRNNRAETVLSPASVPRLQRLWTAEMTNGVTSTPVIAGGIVYVCDHNGFVIAIDAATLAERWRKQALSPFRCGTPLVHRDRIYVGVKDTVYARRLSDGEELWHTKIGDHSDAMIDSSPVLAGNRLVIGLANYQVVFPNRAGGYDGRGAIVALELADGSEAWRFWPGEDNEVSGAGISVWSSAAVDEGRQLIYIGTGQAYEPPAGPYSDALLAINYTTGKLAWHHQYHANDVYADGRTCLGGTENCKDWDIGASPNLFRVKGVDAVGVGSKGGLFKALNRDSGEVLWERQLGRGSALGGVMAVGAVSDDTIFVAARVPEDTPAPAVFATFALDVDTGADRWRVNWMSPVWGAISYANGVVYQSLRDGWAYALDARDGSQLWSYDLGHDAAGGPSVANGRLFIPSGFTGLATPARPGANLNVFALDVPDGGIAGPPDTMDAGLPTGSNLPTFSNVYRAIERAGCKSAFCHGAGAGELTFGTRDVAYRELLGDDGTGAPALGMNPGPAPASKPVCAGTGLKRITPKLADTSLFYLKLVDRSPCGDRMPLTGSAPEQHFTPEELAIVSAWILAGALRDGS